MPNTRHFRSALRIALWWSLVGTVSLGTGGGALAASTSPCLGPAIAAERHHPMPAGLLQAIAVVESGVNGRPHPWALNVNGRVIYANSRETAQRHLKDKQGRIRGRIFAGCMQLSVKHHRMYFASVEQIFDPRENVARAARYLAQHYEESGDWARAIRRYNGGTPRRQAAYLCKVLSALIAIEPRSALTIERSRCGRLGLDPWPPPSSDRIVPDPTPNMRLWDRRENT
jgi:hypothetical protein